MHRERLNSWVMPFGIVSVAYLASFGATFGILMPAQRLVLPDFANYASILFLPHGVRVLTAWLYGWRALLLLAPSALLTHAYLFGTAGFSGAYFFAALFGLFCATFSFWALAKLGMEFRQGHSRMTSWREILLAGSLASIINVAGTSYFYGFEARSASAYFIGDLGGLLVMMAILMLCFRALRLGR
jgi:hypothetical protein